MTRRRSRDCSFRERVNGHGREVAAERVARLEARHQLEESRDGIVEVDPVERTCRRRSERPALDFVDERARDEITLAVEPAPEAEAAKAAPLPGRVPQDRPLASIVESPGHREHAGLPFPL